ncbi:MAG: glycerophosphodiester phosphodiesterase [Halobacteriovoraceae bacterium]|nr:glycerophosphodiester phosphodiesterase [Halobacteriovoraceae bacterium]|tara:strand:- start:11894 stop:12718 length:825 start_codon:yes stop_codon:yes gene_type:complete
MYLTCKRPALLTLSKIIQQIIEWLYLFARVPSPSKAQIDNLKIVAHRGWHDNKVVFENTLKSFDLAYLNNIYGIEFDVRWTKDLVPVIHHDPKLGRVFKGDQKIIDINFSDLRLRYPLIPTLGEVVQKYGGKIHFFIELKDEPYLKVSEQKQTLQQILQELKVQEDFHFLVLKKGPLELLSDFPKSSVLLVANQNFREMSQLAIDESWGGICGHYHFIDDEMLKHHRSHGQKVGTGFPKTMKPLKKELSRDIDWIFTNHPGTLAQLCSKMEVSN